MSILSDIEQRVAQRLEESATPIFWSLQNELRPFIVEGMNEATLITGEPEIRPNQVTVITINQTLQAMPAGALVLLRLESAGSTLIRKVQLWDLDRTIPSWENDTDASLGAPEMIKYWFPLGMTQYGVYPKQTSPLQVVLTYVGMPVTTARPYTGNENVPFQIEYQEAFEEYAAHVARLKEGTQEFFDSMDEYNHFLAKMTEASKYADRKASLRFSRGHGAQAAVTDVQVR